MSELANNFVKSAILNTKKNIPDYFRKCLEQRLSNGQGSVTDFTNVEDLEKQLLNSDWEEYKHPNIADGCSAYKTESFGGYIGMIPLGCLPSDTICRFTDVKGTGTLSLTCYADTDRHPVNYNILIVGDDGFGPCMFTFHPGEPLRPSTLSSDGNNEFGYKEGTTISVVKAILLGFKYAKLQTMKQ